MTPLLEVRHLVKDFRRDAGVFGRGEAVRAVDDVSFSIGPGETFGLVGESGCGKTTTGRCVLRLVEPTAGEILFNSVNLLRLGRADLRRMRRHMQIVFQDPYSSLDPRMRIGRIVEEPLTIHRVGSRDERQKRVRELFDLVGLDAGLICRYPRELSGGQRQRVGIARALALEPSLVIADEPVSSLDATIQTQIVALLQDLQQRLGLAYLFITHDLGIARRISTTVGVMYRGRLIELAPPERLFAAPAHPYTRALLSAIPRRFPGEQRQRVPFDDSRYEARPLRLVAEGHLAAV